MFNIFPRLRQWHNTQYRTQHRTQYNHSFHENKLNLRGKCHSIDIREKSKPLDITCVFETRFFNNIGSVFTRALEKTRRHEGIGFYPLIVVQGIRSGGLYSSMSTWSCLSVQFRAMTLETASANIMIHASDWHHFTFVSYDHVKHQNITAPWERGVNLHPIQRHYSVDALLQNQVPTSCSAPVLAASYSPVRVKLLFSGVPGWDLPVQANWLHCHLVMCLLLPEKKRKKQSKSKYTIDRTVSEEGVQRTVAAYKARKRDARPVWSRHEENTEKKRPDENDVIPLRRPSQYPREQGPEYVCLVETMTDEELNEFYFPLLQKRSEERLRLATSLAIDDARDASIKCLASNCVAVYGYSELENQNRIHANYIALPDKQIAIAAQYPQSSVHSIGKFWRMALQEKTDLIINLSHFTDMLTPYYPLYRDKTELYDGVEVTLISKRGHYSTYNIIDTVHDRSGRITCYHFEDWYDGLDIAPQKLAALIQMINHNYFSHIIIHGELGIGRTMITCAAIIIMDKIRRGEVTHDNKDNVLDDIIISLREQRGQQAIPSAMLRLILLRLMSYWLQYGIPDRS